MGRAVLAAAAALMTALSWTPDAGAQDRETRVLKLVERAERQVERSHRGCRDPNRRPQRATVAKVPPSSAFLATLGVLRRPQRPDEAQVATQLVRSFPVGGIYRPYVRMAQASTGESVVLLPAQKAEEGYRPRSARCAGRLRARVHRLLRGKRVGARRLARTVLRMVIQQKWAGRARPPEEGVFVFTCIRADDCFGGGPTTLSDLRREGDSTAMSVSGRMLYVGVVPDGVASLTLVYRGGTRTTVRVVENVAAVRVARAPREALPDHVVWHDGAGRTLRVVR